MLFCEMCDQSVPKQAGEDQKALGLCDTCYKAFRDGVPEMPRMLGNLITRPIGR